MYLVLPRVETKVGDGVETGATAPALLKVKVGAGAMELALLGAMTFFAGTANWSVSQSFKGVCSQA